MDVSSRWATSACRLLVEEKTTTGLTASVSMARRKKAWGERVGNEIVRVRITVGDGISHGYKELLARKKTWL